VCPGLTGKRSRSATTKSDSYTSSAAGTEQKGQDTRESIVRNVRDVSCRTAPAEPKRARRSSRRVGSEPRSASRSSCSARQDPKRARGGPERADHHLHGCAATKDHKHRCPTRSLTSYGRATRPTGTCPPSKASACHRAARSVSQPPIDQHAKDVCTPIRPGHLFKFNVLRTAPGDCSTA
jgi:hypothetical protein